MTDIIVKVSQLENFKSNFGDDKKHFDDVSNADFKSSYFNHSYDSYVIRMRSNLEKLYNRLSLSYKNVDKWWTSYIDDVKSLESGLSGGSFPTSASAACARSLPELKTTVETLTATGASAVSTGEKVADIAIVGGLSFVEGALKVGEDLLDTAAIAGTAVSSVVTGIYDLGNKITSGVTGKPYNSLTKQMWSDTLKTTSQKTVNGWFDKIYDNTTFGKNVKANCPYFSEVRSVCNTAGYITGSVLLANGAVSMVSKARSVGTILNTSSKAIKTTKVATNALVNGLQNVGSSASEAYVAGGNTGQIIAATGVGFVASAVGSLLGDNAESLEFLGKTGITAKAEAIGGKYLAKISTFTDKAATSTVTSTFNAYAGATKKSFYNNKSIAENLNDAGGVTGIAIDSATGVGGATVKSNTLKEVVGELSEKTKQVLSGTIKTIGKETKSEVTDYINDINAGS